MIELFALVLALTGIARMARTRGASPWLYGLAAGAGGFVVGVVVAIVVDAVLSGPRYQPDDGVIVFDDDDAFGFGARLAGSAALWLWIGLVALYVRYRLGRGIEGPSGSWSCQNCRSINQSYALKCDTCGEAFSSTRTS